MRTSVVVIDWRRRDLTRRCLESRDAPEGVGHFEVVLVVNEALDEDVAWFRDAFPEVVLLPQETNTGFAGGVLAGLRAARGEVVVLLNNDAIACSGFLAAGLRALDEAGPGTAAAAARVVLEGTWLEGDRGPRDDSATSGDGRRWTRSGAAGAAELLNGEGVALDRNGNGSDRGWLSPASATSWPQPLFGFSGGACFLRRDALEEVGSFDESLFMYYEDLDVSWRLRLAGHDIVTAPSAVVVHRHAGSSGSGSGLVRYQSMRNRVAVVLRNATPGMVVRVVARVVVRALLDVVPGREPQLSGRQWRQLVSELPAVVAHAARARRADGVAPEARRRVEAAFLSR